MKSKCHFPPAEVPCDLEIVNSPVEFENSLMAFKPSKTMSYDLPNGFNKLITVK